MEEILIGRMVSLITLVLPDESYHGVKYVDEFGKSAYIVKLRATLLRDLGACMSPFNAYLTNLGLRNITFKNGKAF